MKPGKKFNLVILKNEDPIDYKRWENACMKHEDALNYRVIDLTLNNWLEQVQSKPIDYILTKPAGRTSLFRALYEERLEILVNDLGYKAFPTLQEIKIYESKRYIAYWLKANNIQYPQTDIFYHKKEALEFIKKTNYPIVGKMNIGASGNGVKILKTQGEAEEYIELAFSKGITSKTGPKLSKGKLLQRAWKKLVRPTELKAKLNAYKAVASDVQKGYVILQQFIPHDFEWRAVRIGDSFFAHKKLKRDEMASGSLLKGYENPPLRLLDFVKALTDRFSFLTQAVDIFETKEGDYLVNEMQCIFGQSDPYQMLVDGKMGRYIHLNGKWIFEEGDFNTNESFDLRVKTVIELLKQAKDD
ncbi:MAG: hypothetical protein K9G76_00250 [Bacteroidales bacterium]|nr:hypothetical protein [Bacteroidales bacterium]MCF8402542.1 hypothetical protein [Bacteroidales bacterium]